MRRSSAQLWLPVQLTEPLARHFEGRESRTTNHPHKENVISVSETMKFLWYWTGSVEEGSSQLPTCQGRCSLNGFMLLNVIDYFDEVASANRFLFLFSLPYKYFYILSTTLCLVTIVFASREEVHRVSPFSTGILLCFLLCFVLSFKWQCPYSSY